MSVDRSDSLALPRLMAAAIHLHQQGQIEPAQALYRQVLAVQPDHADALHLLGVVAGQTGNFAHAVDLIRRALAIDTRNAAAHNNLGNALRELGLHSEALQHHDAAIALADGFAQAHNGRAIALHQLMRPDEALQSFDEAIRLVPGYVEAHVNRGLVLLSLDRHQDALDCFDHAIRLAPQGADAHQNRGVALVRMKRLPEALESFNRAIAIHPRSVESYLGRANALRKLNRTAQAVLDYDRVIALRPDHAQAHLTRGSAFQELGNVAEALRCYELAISLGPDDAEPHYNMGTLLQATGRPRDAVLCYARAIAIRPDHAAAHWNMSLCQLVLGDYGAGWPEYEWRSRVEGTSAHRNRRDFPQPLWDGSQTVQGKRILLYGEQGYGDTVQFCRFATLLARRGARVLVEVAPALQELIATVEGVSEVIVRGSALPAFDMHCPLMSLPAAFRTTLASLPAPRSYLGVGEQRLTHWRARIGARSKPRVGIAWSGNPAHVNDPNRSIPLEQMATLLSPALDFFSLQKDVREADLKALRALHEIQDFSAGLESFSDTAALIQQMDLVISVDTSVAHLAGALGKRVWILLPSVPDWRWMLDREDSPWYPSARLFRQGRPGDWAGVLRNVQDALKSLAW